MKKLFLIALMVSSLVSGVFALDLSLSITTEAKNKIAMIPNASMDNIIVYGQSYNALFYDDYTKTFSDLDNVSTVSVQQDDGKNYLQVNKDGEYDGQCVSFVKGLSNYALSTTTWDKGLQITPSISIDPGTVIATFDSNGNYDHKHTAVYLGIRDNYIWVIDQNWKENDVYGTSGTVGIHKIYFTNTGKVSDAYLYHVVE